MPPQWNDVVSEVLIGSTDISRRVKELAISLADHYRVLNPILMVVLKGSFMFASDLSRAIPFPHELEFIRAKSYEGTDTTGKVQIQGLEQVCLTGRHVIIIEDIVDTGLTLSHIYKLLQGEGTASIKCCTLLEKETNRRYPEIPKIDYIAFHIPDKFVVGYGLDFNQRLRHLPFVGVFQQ